VYQLVVIYTSGDSDTGTYGTFGDLSSAIDRAWATPGFRRYEVRPGGDR
jgi:hypothetical protein